MLVSCSVALLGEGELTDLEQVGLYLVLPRYEKINRMMSENSITESVHRPGFYTRGSEVSREHSTV